jgi:hypothetical protein
MRRLVSRSPDRNEAGDFGLIGVFFPASQALCEIVVGERSSQVGTKFDNDRSAAIRALKLSFS